MLRSEKMPSFVFWSTPKTPTSEKNFAPSWTTTKPSSKNPAADENILSIPQRIGHARKVCSSASIRLHCLGSADSHQIAKLMVEGTNMGLIQLSQLMNRHANLTDSVRKQGAEMMQQEEAYLNRLKPYL